MEAKVKSPKKALFPVVMVLLSVILVLSLMFAVTIGSTSIPFSDVYHVIFHKIFGVGDPSWGSGKIHDVVWFIRLPRLILAAAIGMGLSICGVVMQAVVKNPLAEPYVLRRFAGSYFVDYAGGWYHFREQLCRSHGVSGCIHHIHWSRDLI